MARSEKNKGSWILNSFIIFFHFLGHISFAIKEMCLGRRSLSSTILFLTIFRSGAKLVIPIIFISALLASSLVLNIYDTLSPFNLQQQVLLIAQRILFYDILPVLVALILSIQQALNLVTAPIKGLHRTPQELVLMQIIPQILGTNISALFLYIYALNTVLVSIYFCFYVLLKIDLHEYFFHIANTITSLEVVYSILKSLLYCNLVSIIVGYYYYSVAAGFLSLRVGMSRILTRCFIGLGIASIYLKFLDYQG